jgi:hypothetical protein
MPRVMIVDDNGRVLAEDDWAPVVRACTREVAGSLKMKAIFAATTDPKKAGRLVRQVRELEYAVGLKMRRGWG